jgi:glyoxylase-like metal-dependent hydrolase (beta-lactamase superfamily II)
MTAQNPAFKFLEMRDRPPEDAKFFWNGGPVEVAERTWFASMLSGATGFETDDGLVLVDTGTVQFAPTLAAALRAETDAPVHTAIYTHGHVDHAFGLASFLVDGQEAPVVIGHEAMQGRFERYATTSRHNVAVNNRQFSGVPGDETMAGADEVRWEQPSHPPTVTYRDEMTLEVGGVRLRAAPRPGETDDHTWVFCPDRGVLCPGDLIIWGVPNAGNPQKVQRYPWDWAVGLRAMAAKQPRRRWCRVTVGRWWTIPPSCSASSPRPPTTSS